MLSLCHVTWKEETGERISQRLYLTLLLADNSNMEIEQRLTGFMMINEI